MNGFEAKLSQWLSGQIALEGNSRRRELLQKEIGHGTKEFLKTIWYPAVGNFDHLKILKLGVSGICAKNKPT